MPCPGLGRVRRGFETFTAECCAALSDDPSLEVRVFSGGSAAPGSRRVPSLDRHGRAARALGRVTGRAGGYGIEQATFGAALVPRLIAGQPDMVFVSDIALARLLAGARRRLRLRYRVLLSNGGLTGPPYDGFDHVQQLAPVHLEEAVARGLPAERQTLLPYGIQPATPVLAGAERDARRRRLQLPTQRPALLSVAAIESRQKRLDVLIEEVARLPPDRRPFLVLLGQPEDGASQILALATARLGAGGFTARAVAAAEVDAYLRAADAFVLSSLVEGLPRAALEAAVRGLPCLVHDGAVNHFALGDHGVYVDTSRPGELAAGIPAVLEAAASSERRRRQAAWVSERFAWPRLVPRYVEMLHRVAGR